MTNTPNTPSYDRQLYESQLRLNGQLVNDIDACKKAHAEQAEELTNMRGRDEAAADLAVAHNDLLAIWGERLTWLEGLFIDMLEADEQGLARGKAIDARVKASKAMKRVELFASRMDPNGQ